MFYEFIYYSENFGYVNRVFEDIVVEKFVSHRSNRMFCFRAKSMTAGINSVTSWKEQRKTTSPQPKGRFKVLILHNEVSETVITPATNPRN